MKKPDTIKGDLAHLPIALTPLMALPHWVLWRWEFRRGIWTKPPYMANGARAKNNDPATWVPYESALAAVQNGGNYDGIGFCLREAPIDCVDLDHCLDPATGQMDAWAKRWIDAANGAYVERTPSGEGLRIIAGMGGAEKLHRKWKVRDVDARDGAAIEVYRNCERYITVTGLQVGDCRELSSVNGLLEQIKEEMERTGKHSGERSGTRFDFNTAGNKRGGKAGSKIDYDDVIQNGAPDGVDVSALFHSVIGHLYGKGMSVDEIVEELAKWVNGIGQRYAGRLEQEVRRSFEKWEAKAAETADDETLWDGLDRSRKPRSTCTTARRALKALGIKCRYDEFHDKLLIDDGHENLDYTALMLRKQIHKEYKFDPGTKNTFDAIVQIAMENAFDPVKDYIDGLAWDGKPRLDHWLTTYLGAEDTELNRAFGRLALIAAVRRVRHPGVKFDPIIVLEGEMGTEKSKVIETMAGIGNFSDQTILGARDREQQELLAGIWLYEIAELTNIRKTDVEHIKAFASRTHDRARPAYGRTRVDRPRRCVLFATTNNDEYLKEADRRFWPVRAATIGIEALKRDRDQLWAEAAQREREDASIVLDRRLWGSARIEQEAREEGDPWDDVLSEVIGTVEPDEDEERVESSDLLTTVLGIPSSKQRDIDYKRLSRCMRRLGWDGPKRIRISDKVKRGYARPAKRRP